MNKNIKLLEHAYLVILGILLVLIVFAPYIIHTGFTLVEEQFAEAIFIAVLFAMGYAILLLYQKEAAKNQNRLKQFFTSVYYKDSNFNKNQIPVRELS